MAILKKCLNSILYTEDSILKLELLGDDFLYNANGIIEENPNLKLEEYFIEFNELHGDFKNIFEIYSQGMQKLLEFNLLNSGIKLSSKIDLKKQKFTELDLGKLYSALKDNTYNVSELLFKPDMKINRDFLFVLKENKTLKLVSFKDCIIQDIVGLTDVIRENIIIKSLNFARSKLTSEHIIEIANALEQNLTLKELNLSGNMDEVEEVTNECIVSLANALESNKTLLRLDISHMPYSDKGVIAIAGALKLNSTLKKINLSHTYSITDEGVEAIAEALEYNKTLEEIDLQESSITDEGVIAIAEALKLNSTLKKINLSANAGITDKGVIAMAEALKLNSTLKEINLANSTITEHGMATFIECLEFNSSLQEVSFMSRNIGFESFIQMVSALKINESLKSVCLFVNDNGNTAAYEIAELLSTNSKLQKLNLYLRDVTDEGAIVIAEALKLNSTLKEINLSRNNIGNSGVATIVEALKLNGNIKKVLLENNNVTDENAIINLFKENDVLVTCGIPIVENNAILIDIMNRKYESVKQEIDTIKFYGVSDEDLVNRYTKLVQLKSFKDLLHESENTLDSYREKLLESIFFFKPNLIDRCELLHKLFIIEKDNIKYIQDDSMLKLLDQGMHGDFDKIVFTLLDYQLAGEEKNIYSMLPNYESIDKLLKILQCEDISLKSAVDKYTAIIECDPYAEFEIGNLMQTSISLGEEKIDIGLMDNEKMFYNDIVKDYITNEELLRELLCTELNKLLGEEAWLLSQ